MATIKIHIGNTSYVVESEQIPPVGTRIMTDKYFSSDGSETEVEVTSHQWRLFKNDDAEFDVTIFTKILDKR